jgi:hypothetical protein
MRIPMCPTVAPMSERSIYLRDQAAKCRWHADHMTDAETLEQVRKLAAEYIERAAEIESKEAPLKAILDLSPVPDRRSI